MHAVRVMATKCGTVWELIHSDLVMSLESHMICRVLFFLQGSHASSKIPGFFPEISRNWKLKFTVLDFTLPVVQLNQHACYV